MKIWNAVRSDDDESDARLFRLPYGMNAVSGLWEQNIQRLMCEPEVEFAVPRGIYCKCNMAIDDDRLTATGPLMCLFYFCIDLLMSPIWINTFLIIAIEKSSLSAHRWPN